MMKPSTRKLSPVVTLLSPSPGASRRAQEILGNVFGLEEDVELGSSSNNNNHTQDDLNEKFQSALFPSTMQWDSVASKCRHSGLVLHWLSLENSGNKSDKTQMAPFSLLGITHQDTITETRSLLASHFPDSTSLLRFKHVLGRPLTSDALLSRHQGLPILELPQEEQQQQQQQQQQSVLFPNGSLKEIAFTTYDDAVYDNGETVLSRLSSSLSRPVTGLYEWPTTTTSSSSRFHLRPLPAAQQDWKGHAPSVVVLTFYCNDVDEKLEDAMQTLNTTTNSSDDSSSCYDYRFGKIGYTGQGKGQVRVQVHSTPGHVKEKEGSIVNYLPGLDIRWCESTKPTSMFNEAHESLLASSLLELQSTNVLGRQQQRQQQQQQSNNNNATGTQQQQQQSYDYDEKIGSADCWVEVRTMVKNPTGFFKRSGQRIAKPPPSYPE